MLFSNQNYFSLSNIKQAFQKFMMSKIITETEQWRKKEMKIKLEGSNYYLFTDKHQA